MKILEENIDKEFVGQDAIENKSKIRQLGLYQTKNFCTAKVSVNSEETTY
jgi:hypothetical protein